MSEPQLTYSELWVVIGATLEGYGEMPLSGLCLVLSDAVDGGLLSAEQYDKMYQQLYQYHSKLGATPRHGYLWSPFELAPRVRACYKLAELCEGITTWDR